MTAYWAAGTTLTRAGNPIATITSLTGPKESATTREVTPLSSTGFSEFIVTVRDAGEVSMEGIFDPADTLGMVAMHADLASGTMRAYVLTFPAAVGANMTFNGFVTAFETGAPRDSEVPFSATVKITGAATLNITASNNITVLAGIEETGAAALDFVPNFAAATYAYTCDGINTASTYIQITATFAAGIGTVTALGVTQSIVSTVQSGQILLGAANTLTDVVISIKETNKIATTYTLHVARP